MTKPSKWLMSNYNDVHVPISICNNNELRKKVSSWQTKLYPKLEVLLSMEYQMECVGVAHEANPNRIYLFCNYMGRQYPVTMTEFDTEVTIEIKKTDVPLPALSDPPCTHVYFIAFLAVARELAVKLGLAKAVDWDHVEPVLEVADASVKQVPSPPAPSSGTMVTLRSKYERNGYELGKLVTGKNVAYGDSFARSGAVLREIYPNGVKPEQYTDMLAMVRVLDKMFRIGAKKDAFGENPWRDIGGYALLGMCTATPDKDP